MLRYSVAALALTVATVGMAGTPDLEILEGSSVTLEVAGAQRTIDPQSIPMRSHGEVGFRLASLDAIDLPGFNLAFGEQLDIHQNQAFVGDVDPGNGVSALEFWMWLIDPDGNRIEIPVALTTDVPSTLACNGSPVCQGLSGEPDHCEGQAWNPATGDLQLVGVVVIPFGTGTTVDCSAVSFVIEANVAAGDADADLVEDLADSCPDTANPAPQSDQDADGVGDACDNCITTANTLQHDDDQNGFGNACQPLQVNFQPQAAATPAGYLADSGTAFDGTSGWIDAGSVSTAEREMDPDQRLDTLALIDVACRWEAVQSPGSYDLELSVGDPALPQGPHVVIAEGVTAFSGESTNAGEPLQAMPQRVPVLDGRVTLEVGDGGTTTALDYFICVESSDQPFFGRYVNFQPSASTTPVGFTAQTGGVYDPQAGMGWDIPVQTRDRGVDPDPLLDTFVFTRGNSLFELDLPPDFYLVRLAMGDPKYDQGPQTLVVEGQTWVQDAMVPKGEYLVLERWVQVLDGRLSITLGQVGGFTILNYLAVASLPRDADGDGHANFMDNCPEDSNADQQDTDANGVGDVCSIDGDQDGWADDTDNCPLQSNPAQDNQDGDARGDLCDCAPADGGSYAPVGEVGGLVMLTQPFELVAWDSQAPVGGPGARYDLITQSLSSLVASGQFAEATCLAENLFPTAYEDTRTPPAGDGYLYLVRARNACGVGTYGAAATTPDPRVDLDASGPCP